MLKITESEWNDMSKVTVDLNATIFIGDKEAKEGDCEGSFGKT